MTEHLPAAVKGDENKLSGAAEDEGERSRELCCDRSVSSLFQDINKRLSLPADIRLPDDYLEKFNVIGPALFEQPISRRLRRVSLVCLTASFHFHAGVWDSFGLACHKR